eukprot:m.177016 g.177016  ORF g.177016 m.177016 type:complete len:292 (+) comp17958_c0_seq1:1203-2078(+)
MALRRPTVVLLDIEGTTTSISFVKDTLFPYARENVEAFLADKANQEAASAAVALLRQQATEDVNEDLEGAVAIPEGHVADSTVLAAAVQNVHWQMSIDRKTTALKSLQGQIWQKAYQDGVIKGHLYDDVEPALRTWKDQGIKIYIYSSGSIKAQKLLFGHSQQGDIKPLLSGYFDTTTGHKREAESYVKIAQAIDTDPATVLFLTDVVQEARAAKAAGMNAVLSVRPGNTELDQAARDEFQTITSFEQLAFAPEQPSVGDTRPAPESEGTQQDAEEANTESTGATKRLRSQ